MSTDQEGGPIRSVQFAGPDKAQPEMGSSEEVRTLYRGAGKELRAVGVNVDFAPVADVANGGASILQGRVFRGGYGQVSADVAAAVQPGQPVQGVTFGHVLGPRAVGGRDGLVAAPDDDPASSGAGRAEHRLSLIHI